MWADGAEEASRLSSSNCKRSSPPVAAAEAAPAAAAGAEGVLPAELAERYVLERELGRGVYGAVYMCQVREPEEALSMRSASSPDDALGLATASASAPAAAAAAAVRVAVKQVSLPCWRLKGVFGVDQQVLRELCALRSLSHANIVALKAFHFSMEPWQQHQQQQQQQQQQQKKRRKRLRPTFYLITELCDADLAEALAQQQRRHHKFIKRRQQQQQQRQPMLQELQQDRWKWDGEDAPLPGFSEEEAKLIVYQLLQALAHCHSRGLLHRDVKPQNIFLTKEVDALSGQTRWVVRLGDFGLSCPFLEREEVKTGGVITLLYRAPELLLGCSKYGPEVDVWAAAAVAAELVLGRPLFRCSSELLLLSRMQQLLGPEAAKSIEAMAGQQQAGAPQLKNFVSFDAAFVDACGRRLLSEEGVSFIKSLLAVQPDERPSCLWALSHPWLRSAVRAFANLQVYIHPTPAPSLPLHYLPMDPLNQRHLFAPNLQQQQQQRGQQQEQEERSFGLVAPWEEGPIPQQIFDASEKALAAAKEAARQWHLGPRFVAEALALP
ncbi:hypothetical protein Esti_002831 [Eimeria stiedai]